MQLLSAASKRLSLFSNFSMRNNTFIIFMNKFYWIFNCNIFAVLVLLISFTIAASVVDFPEPVGPVTKTNPLCISTIS